MPATRRKSARNQPSPPADNDDTANSPNPASAATGSNPQLYAIEEGNKENAGNTNNAGIAASVKAASVKKSKRKAKAWSDSGKNTAAAKISTAALSTLTAEAVAAVTSITESVAKTITSL